ncbi:hypothetical protein GDO81_024037 [Engystomops pustulosus]|uniref:Uncharacterized protein n=2 Tax=Engystomops pustulosus TaxID=76066 RepID=A0AAV6Z8H6_ENGPU|nr:hypothetical protein GDO81_024037 [Engystomops pustulosus]
MATSQPAADQPGDTREGQKFYQQPLYIPPAQSFGREAHVSSQPPSYSQTQQDPKPASPQVPQESQQCQQNTFYQYQQSFSCPKKSS